MARPQFKVNISGLIGLVFFLVMFGACAAGPPSPPPDPGRVISKKEHSFYYFDIRYSVGRLNDHLRVVGQVGNAVPTDLNQFMVSLTVKDSAGRTLAKTSSNFFDVTDMESTTFSLDLPLLHGPCTFSFRCDYEHYDDMDETRWGRSFQASDWNYFDDKINLP